MYLATEHTTINSGGQVHTNLINVEIIGDRNTFIDCYNILVIGNYNVVEASYSEVRGKRNKVTGNRNWVQVKKNEVIGDDCKVRGSWNTHLPQTAAWYAARPPHVRELDRLAEEAAAVTLQAQTGISIFTVDDEDKNEGRARFERAEEAMRQAIDAIRQAVNAVRLATGSEATKSLASEPRPAAILSPPDSVTDAVVAAAAAPAQTTVWPGCMLPDL